MRISTKIKSLLLCAAAFTSFSAYAVEGVETEAGAVAANTAKDNDIVGTCYTIPATHNPSGSGNAQGTMPRKGLKLRTGNDGSRLVFSANAPYSITGLYFDAYANSSTGEMSITKVEVDGVEIAFDAVIVPGKSAGSAAITLDGFVASESIALYFQNTDVEQKQIYACYELTWVAPDPEIPTISGVQETLKLIPGATAQLKGTIDYPDAFTAVWVSADESIATVDADGVVTAVAPGTTTISYAWDQDQSVCASCELTVADIDMTQYEAVATYDFTAMGNVTLTVEDVACGNVWNDSNSKANPIYRLTNEGLTQMAVQAVYSSGKGWIIEDSLGLKQYTNRCAAVMDLVQDQIVEVIYTGSGFYTKGGLSSKGAVITAGDGAEKEALNEGAGRAIYKLLEDGLFGFELAKDQVVKQINIYAPKDGGDEGIVVEPGTYTYALTEGETHTAGETVELKVEDVAIATLTFGVEGGADFNPAKAHTAIEGFTAYTEGNGENGAADAGTVYYIVPAVDAKITVGVALNANKTFYILEDGIALENYNGHKEEEKYYGTYSFMATAGKTYSVYCTGSKLGFYGFKMDVGGETTGIENIEAPKATGIAYDLMGRRAVGKGLMIRDGKVIMVK